MASRIVTVGSTVGLHARPAATIADLAVTFNEDVTLHLVGEDDEGADATSSLMIMALGAQHGDQVEIISTNAAAVDAIADLVAANLDQGSADMAF